MNEEHRNTAGLLAIRETMEAWPMEEEIAETAYWMAERLELFGYRTIRRLIAEHDSNVTEGKGGTLDLATETAKLGRHLTQWTCYSDNTEALAQLQRFAAAYRQTRRTARKNRAKDCFLVH